MAIDRGGLRYEIEVVTKNLSQLRRLRRELKLTFQAQSQVTKGQVAAARRQSQLAAANARTVTAQERAKRAILDTRAARQRLNREIHNQLAAQQKLIASTAAAARQQALLAGNAGKTAKNTKKAAAGIKATGVAAESAAARVNKLLFTFRRLVGTLALFQAARAVAGGFASLIKGGVQFNATLETVQIGIAGLLTNIAVLTDKNGNLVEGAEKFALAQTVAADQAAKLKREAILTVATLEELSRAFQEGLAPALSAGLDVDQARKVAILVSQAAAALNISQNQLGEELRSLLSGTATERTTRIAKAFGVSAAELNELVRGMRDGDELFKFITDRLQGTAIAAGLAAKSFSGLTSNLRDAISVVSGEAGKGLFDTLKQQMADIIQLFVTPIEGDILVNPEVIKALEPIFDGVRDAVLALRAAMESLTAGDFRGAVDAIGSALAGVGSAIAIAVQFLITALGPIGDALGALRAVISTILSLLPQLPFLTRQFARVVGVILGAVAATKAWRFAVVALTKAQKLFNLAVLANPYVLIAAAIITIISLVRRFADEIKLSSDGLATFQDLFVEAWESIKDGFAVLVDIVKDLVGELEKALRDIFPDIELNFKALIQFIGTVADKVIGGWIIMVRIMQGVWSTGWEAIGDIALNIVNGILNTFEVMIDVITAAFVTIGRTVSSFIKNTLAGYEFLFKAMVAGVKREFGKAISFTAQAKSAFTQAGKALSGVGDTFTKSLQEEFGNRLLPTITNPFEGAAKKLATIVAQAFAEGLTFDQVSKRIDEFLKRVELRAQERQRKKDTENLGGGRGRDKQADNALKLLKLEEKRLKIFNQIADLRGLRPDTEARILDLNLELNVQQGIVDILNSKNALTDEENALLELTLAKMVLISEQRARLGDGSFLAGLEEGLRRLSEGFDEFKLGIDAIQSGIAVIGDGIADAIFEGKDLIESLVEGFKGILKNLVSQVIQKLLTDALLSLITKTATSAATMTAAATQAASLLAAGGVKAGAAMVAGAAKAAAILAGASAAGAAGGVTGGQVSHIGAKGYADGGSIHGPRPAGLDPRDTVPIWAQPGEFMQPLASVRTYGSQFMEAVRKRALPAGLMRALGSMAQGGRMPTLATRGPGYATGGQVAIPAGSSGGGTLVVEVRSTDIVNDGLSRDTIRVVSPGIKEPRNVAESKGETI
jgi:phage-related protein